MVTKSTPTIELPDGRSVRVTIDVDGPNAEAFAYLAITVYEIQLRNGAKEPQPCSR